MFYKTWANLSKLMISYRFLCKLFQISQKILNPQHWFQISIINVKNIDKIQFNNVLFFAVVNYHILFFRFEY